MIRLLALDLDGTLIGADLHISPRVRRAIAAAQERGVVATLATGRMFESTLPFARTLSITAPLICYQGGLIQAPDARSPLYRAMLDRALAREALELHAQHGWRAALYADNQVFIAERQRPDRFYQDYLGERLNWGADLDATLAQRTPDKVLFIAEPDEADIIEETLRQRFDGRAEVTRSHARFVEVNPPGVSKGDALRRLANHLDIPQTQVMAIGDQGNDIAMIAWAGIGVAMGNASADVQAVADWVAPPLEDDGAAIAIERFILNR